jgi:hypothetical protein
MDWPDRQLVDIGNRVVCARVLSRTGLAGVPRAGRGQPAKTSGPRRPASMKTTSGTIIRTFQSIACSTSDFQASLFNRGDLAMMFVSTTTTVTLTLSRDGET